MYFITLMGLTILIILRIIYTLNFLGDLRLDIEPESNTTSESNITTYGTHDEKVEFVRANQTDRYEKIIDFAVVGFAKTGTSSLMTSLHKHPEVFMGFEKNLGNAQEISSLTFDLVDEFKTIFKNNNNGDHKRTSTSTGKQVINGFKEPNVLVFARPMVNIEKHFPETDFIVSTRHPVLYFESFYNFRARNPKFKEMFPSGFPDPLSLIGSSNNYCANSNKKCDDRVVNFGGVCTTGAKFHYGLSRLMVTPMNTTDELVLLDHHDWSKHPGYKGRIFFIEIAQLGDKNETRKAQFTSDLEDFLGLTRNSFHWETSNMSGGRNNEINICDEKFKTLRDHLVAIGKKSSRWILEYFLKSSRVVVSDREYLVERIKTWQTDPCDVVPE